MKRNWFRLLAVAACLVLAVVLAGCGGDKNTASRDTIMVDLGEDAPTLDPTMSEDTQSARVAYDLFEGLVSFDQKLDPIPGLAERWDISPDKRTYTFYLRPGIKFSDDTPITADDVVFTWQRLVDPKVGSPYNFLGSNVVNGQAVIDGKLPVSELGVRAIDPRTVEIKLEVPDPSFLNICSMPNVAILSKANITKYGDSWTEPGKMVSSGAYKLAERVIKGYILLEKNEHYYDAANVAISKVKFLPIVETSSALNQFKSGGVDLTWSVPSDQYQSIKKEFGDQLHTVPQEALYYYDLNMTLPKFKNNPKLRQALSMAVDRETLVTKVMGQGQVPAYSYVTATVENGQFAGLDYEWSKWPRDKQVEYARQLFAEAGYGPGNPLEITISYNTNEGHKKIALAIGSMWEDVFGKDSIVVKQANQEWKTFLRDRSEANYDVARDGWVADYDSVDSYTVLYTSGGPQNNSKTDTPGYNELLDQAKRATDPAERVRLIRQAVTLAMSDYGIIPLYQYTYSRLISSRVKGYDPKDNHLDHVMSKWYKF